jgi:hypothetical protein
VRRDLRTWFVYDETAIVPRIAATAIVTISSISVKPAVGEVRLGLDDVIACAS